MCVSMAQYNVTGIQKSGNCWELFREGAADSKMHM